MRATPTTYRPLPSMGDAATRTAQRRVTQSSSGRRERRREIPGVGGRRDQVPLAARATEAHQCVELVLGLDPLGDDLEVERVRQRQLGRDQLTTSRGVEATGE